MALTRSYPAHEVQSLQEGFNRWLNQSLAPFFGNEEGLMSTAWVPPVDICEGQDHVSIECDVPGVKPENISLTVENNVLTLRGERQFEKKSEADNYHRVERSYGSFTRTFALPTTVETDSIQAHCENGVLRITLAKRQEAKPRQIQIAVNQEPGQLKASQAKVK